MNYGCEKWRVTTLIICNFLKIWMEKNVKEEERERERERERAFFSRLEMKSSTYQNLTNSYVSLNNFQISIYRAVCTKGQIQMPVNSPIFIVTRTKIVSLHQKNTLRDKLSLSIVCKHCSLFSRLEFFLPFRQ